MTKAKEKKFFNESGKISKEQIILLCITGVILIAVIILIIIMMPKPPPPEKKEPEPVYEIKLKDVIRFKLQEAKDRGDVLKTTESKKGLAYVRYDATTTEKFIEVTIAVDNIGKDNVPFGSWDIKEIYDKEGKKFYSSNFLNYWSSFVDNCGDLLKPGFTPTLCSKIYDVAKSSTGLKLEVYFKENKTPVYIDLGL